MNLKVRSPKFSFNAARGIMCVGTKRLISEAGGVEKFQCRTRHYVCRDSKLIDRSEIDGNVSMPHAALCVSGHAAY